MNDDYLWDRTGEPDTQIQELEQVLGTLRYQPRPLPIPAQVVTVSRQKFFRSFTPTLAIAATIAIMLMGLGVWSAWRRSQTTEISKMVSGPTSAASSADPLPGKSNANSNGATTDNHDQRIASHRANDESNRSVKSAGHRIRPKMFARPVEDPHQPALNASEPVISELKEAESAKVQLMLALRVASSKLNFAQKKTQGTNFENMIHNQHKTG